MNKIINYLSGWHRALQEKLQVANLKPHEFIEVLMDENLIREQRYYRLRSGTETAPPMREKQRKRLQRIKSIILEFGKREPLVYLEDLSYSIKLDDGRFDDK